MCRPRRSRVLRTRVAAGRYSPRSETAWPPSYHNDTDFYGATNTPYPGVAKRCPSDKNIVRVEGDVTLLPRCSTSRRAAQHIVDSLTHSSEAKRVTIDSETGADSFPLELSLADHGTAVAESFTIGATESGATARSATATGLERAAATIARALNAADADEPVQLPLLTDAPATRIRFLGGWALCRQHDLKTAIDIGWAYRANRVLFNAWGWLVGERVAPDIVEHVDYARERGIELVFELRRMGLGTSFDTRSETARRELDAIYRSAVAAGFRSFGLLFDDVAWDTAEEECSLVLSVLESLRREVDEPEFFCCPRYYWSPGQMNAAWTGRCDAAETAAQRDYLQVYGRELPEDVHIYIANAWGGHTDSDVERLQEFVDAVGRQPIFFDNQQINDYRHGAILPFALHSRPRDFGERYAGYYLNAGRPLAAYAPACASALEFAWAPNRYDPELAMADALRWFYSRGEETRLREAWTDLALLATEWSCGTTTAVDHYATIWTGIQDGAITDHHIRDWKARVERLAAILADVAPSDSRPAGLVSLVEGLHRLAADIDLFEQHFAQPEKRCAR